MANADTLTSSLPELTPGSTTEHPKISPEDVPVPPSPVLEPQLVVEPAPVRSTLVPLGSQAPAAPPVHPPHPKRFSAVNINKKFLEKNSSSSSTSAPSSINSAASKSGGTISRPQTQTTASHSRLVTTKLTAAPQSLSAAGPGWSRPPSATPPASTATSVNGAAAPTTTASGPDAPTSTNGPPVIQTQPRPLPARGSGSREGAHSGAGSGKPVWGNTKAPQQQRPDMTSQSDFPTAAEVAAAPRKVKPTLADRNLVLKEAAALELASAAANKQARMEEADTFRGVHLDPNAHHWDEMEEDDDNFLDGVIEFGDGRQYKIESADATLPTAESADSVVPSRLDEPHPSNVPVSKEERFADDFDRSWPRSRASPSISTRDLPSGASALSTHSASSVAAPSPVSPAVSLHGGLQDSSASRALLFNERSNKLEPYNRVAGTAGPGQKRGGDGFPSPTDTRGREFPSGQQGHNNVQLLQNRGRGLSAVTGGGFNHEHRQQGRRDGMPAPPAHAPPPPSPRMPVNPWTQKKDAEAPEVAGRRLSTMGPPPVPTGLGASGGRQRPPHLPLIPSEVDGLPPRAQRRPSTSRESRLPPPTAPTPEPARAPSQSPALSHTSAVAHSPVVSAPQLSGPDLDEVRKDVMHGAAARAKARRQQEEEERAKAQERARRKAAEIEEQIKAAEAEKAKAQEAEKAAQAQDVLDIIETAVKSVEKPEAHTLPKPAPPFIVPASDLKPPVRRPSHVGPPPHPPLETRPGPPRRISTGPPVLSPVDTGSSWRSKASPVSATVPTPVRQVQPRPSIPSFVPPPTALDRVESLAENPEEELEVVDFSDLAKFIGVTEEAPEQEPVVVATPTRPPRPVASDFFDDRPSPSGPSAHEKTNVVTWRRQGVQEPEPSHTQPDESKDRSRSDVAPEASFTSETLSTGSTKDTSLSVDHHSSSHHSSSTAVAVPVPPHANRTPRSQPFYKEATMSTLDDVMSRIKGAIDGMQTSEREHRSPEVSATPMARSSLFHPSSATTSVQKERWVPPAFRARHFDSEPQEVIVTGYEPPRSPKPAWNTFIIRLPKVSQPLELVNRKQLLMCNRPNQFRWDVLSFDPPVEGMSRREFTVNEILFRRTGFKGKNKYKVLLPSTKTTGPRVNIPMSPRVNGVGAFGRPSADGVSTWRKPFPSASNLDLVESETGLSTMSRSPPPELPSDPSIASIPRTDVLASSRSEDVFGPSRSRSQPKMPAGSAVAFYRGSRVDAVEPDAKLSVNFIVSSELEDSRQISESSTPSKSKPSIMVSSPAYNSLAPSESLSSASKPFTPRANGLKTSPNSSPEIGMPSLMSNSKTESKSSDDSTDRTPITPPSHHTASWARSSLNISVKDPLRGPDPEHLKAVWLQTSNKAGLHAVNSLEGIADDLTAIPFTLQDVKSEDGGTPPPTTSIASSRMSLHDVTRAFQQVPSSSSSSSLRPPISPPSTSAPVARPPTYSYPSPSPGVMYPMAPSPVPARMAVNGHAPLYSGPVWMAPQNHSGMMRPMGSPYPQMMYPSPGGTPMYPPQPQPMQNTQPQPNGPRGRSMSSNAMYPGSPILMHAPPMPVGYMSMPAGRGQMRNDNGHPPMQPHQQHQHQQQQQQHPQHQPNGHTMHATGYNPVPSTSFVRPTW
ncbi:hypothetical protein B0H11DRAFT_2053948 [Mycena galericulata]|nr:hypothetical protein B0H11DRAFT_2053948 [Mycena galericulata]